MREMTDKRIRLIDIALIIYTITIFLFTDDLETIAYSQYAFIAFTAIFLEYAFRVLRIIDISIIKVLIPLLVFSFFSVLMAEDKGLAFSRAITIATLCIMSVMIYSSYIKIGNTQILLIALILGGLSVAVNIVNVYTISGMLKSLSQGSRAGAEELQLNYLGRYTYLSAIISFYFANVEKKLVIPMYLAFGMSGLVCVVSGSRQAILALVFAVTSLYLANGFSKSKLSALFKILVVGISAYFILQTPVLDAARERLFSGLSVFMRDSTASHSDQKRAEMIIVGFKAFLESPIWGNGFGNARYLMTGDLAGYYYLHNTYIELLATGGILGFLCYYLIYFAIFRKMLKCRKLGVWNFELTFVLILLLGQLLLEFFSVGYYSKPQYLVFMYAYVTVDKAFRGIASGNAIQGMDC